MDAGLVVYLVLSSRLQRSYQFLLLGLAAIGILTGQNEQFELQAGYIMRGGLKVAVFEAKTPYKSYLWDLDPQRVNNLRAEQEDLEKYAGLKVGSMDEPSTSGNWESL